jgi:hypothetical protein
MFGSKDRAYTQVKHTDFFKVQTEEGNFYLPEHSEETHLPKQQVAQDGQSQGLGQSKKAVMADVIAKGDVSPTK